MLAAAALLMAAAVQAPVTAPPALSDLAPGERAAALAASSFAFGCLQRLGAAGTAEALSRGSDDLGAQLARDHPDERAAFQMDGAGGRGCRVRYRGPHADQLWRGLTGVVAVMAPTPDGGGCVVAETTDVRVRAACTDTAPKPPRTAALELDRSAAAGQATVTASLLPRS